MKIAAMCGSLRKQSFNRALLKVAQEEAPSGVTVEILDISHLPLFDQDYEEPLPPAVADFKAEIIEADAILFAVPEYNYSFSGVLKNAIDWASRPYGKNVWDGKIAGIMGGSMGMQGTCRAQYHLRQVFVYLNIHTLNKPEVMVGSIHEKFDKSGKLIDSKTREKVAELVQALVEKVRAGK